MVSVLPAVDYCLLTFCLKKLRDAPAGNKATNCCERCQQQHILKPLTTAKRLYSYTQPQVVPAEETAVLACLTPVLQ